MIIALRLVAFLQQLHPGLLRSLELLLQFFLLFNLHQLQRKIVSNIDDTFDKSSDLFVKIVFLPVLDGCDDLIVEVVPHPDVGLGPPVSLVQDGLPGSLGGSVLRTWK